MQILIHSSTDPLPTLRPGEEGVITQVLGSPLLVSRLRELGVIPGSLIRLLRSGCPLVIQVGEGRFCLRRQDAVAIQVSPSNLPIPVPSSDHTLQ